MSFREHVTSETSALTARLFAGWNEQSRSELDALRRTLDAAAQATAAALETIGTGAPPPAVAELVERLTEEARTEKEAATARITAEAQAKIDAIQQELQTAIAEKAKMADTIQALRAEAHRVTSDLKQQTEETSQVRADLVRIEQAYAALDQNRVAIEARLQQAQQDAASSLRDAEEQGHTRVREAEQAAQALMKELEDQAAAGLATAKQQAQAEIDKANEAKRSLEQQLNQVNYDLEQSRLESADVTKQLETEAADRAKLAAILGRAQSQCQAAESARKKIAGELEAAEGRITVLERTQADLEHARQGLQHQLENSGSGDAALHEELATLRKELTETTARLETERKQLQQERQERREQQEQFEQERQERQEQQTGRDEAAKGSGVPLDRLLNAFQKLEQSRSVRDVLAALVDGLASEFPRVAAFEVNGNRLETLRQLGFDSERDISKVVIPLSMESILTEAVTTGRIQSLTGSDLADGSRALFGGVPGFILVLPIAVGDEVLAVLYADDSGRSAGEAFAPQNQVKFAQLLLWHAVPRLPRLVREERERAELQDYAVHLVQQLQETYEADVKAGRKGEELARRVGENLKCARQMFEGRASELEGAEGMFDERVNVVLEETKNVPFGKDLGTATGRKGGRDQGKKARHVS